MSIAKTFEVIKIQLFFEDENSFLQLYFYVSSKFGEVSKKFFKKFFSDLL